MNSTSREIRSLNIKSFFNQHCLWDCYRCCLSCFLLFGQRAPACIFGPSVCSVAYSLCFEVCLLFVVCLNISLPFIQLLLFEQGTSVSVLFKLSLKFQRNVLEHCKSRSSFACNQNIKEDISTALEGLPCFKTKRNETLTDPPRKHPRRASNIRGRNGCNV